MVAKIAQLRFFYTEWCPHCEKAKSGWDALKAEYDGKVVNNYTVEFNEYNCTNFTDELLDEYEIEGYPTIKLIKDNQTVEYDLMKSKPTKTTMEQFLNSVCWHQESIFIRTTTIKLSKSTKLNDGTIVQFFTVL